MSAVCSGVPRFVGFRVWAASLCSFGKRYSLVELRQFRSGRRGLGSLDTHNEQGQGSKVMSHNFTVSYPPNKSLKLVQRVALHWTPSTGAASQYRAGFSRRLAPRYAL